MAITGGNWASSTDPFTIAESIVFPGGATSTGPPYHVGFANMPAGPMQYSVDNLDAVEIYWAREADPKNQYNAPAHWVQGGMGYLESIPVPNFDSEVPDLTDDDRASGTLDTFATGLQPRAMDATNTYNIQYAPGVPAGWYQLWAYYAYGWFDKDPAQVLFSFVAHKAGGQFALKDYLDQTTFQAASDYYDQHRLRLSLIRDADTTFSAQIKKIVDHSADMIAIRPTEATGEYKLHYYNRTALPARTTVLDLDGPSVSTYTIRPSDEFTLDALTCAWGSIMGIDSSIGNIYNPGQFRYDVFPGTGGDGGFNNRFIGRTRQHVRNFDDRREVFLDLPYVQTLGESASHNDLNYWREDQEEVEVEFADLSHYNYEAGDQVLLTGGNFTGVEKFLVTEKDHEIKGETASVRLLRLQGMEGKPPLSIDGDNWFMAFRSNNFGKYLNSYVDGVNPTPINTDLFSKLYPMPMDRWSGEAANPIYRFSAHEMDRGTSGAASGIPNTPELDQVRKNGWPVLNFESAQECCDLKRNSAVADHGDADTTTAQDFTFYFVIDPAVQLIARYLLDLEAGALTLANSGGGTPNAVQFNSPAGWQGTQTTVNGWQILTFVLDGSGANLAKIRRSGADLETGLNYTRVRVQNNVNCALGGLQDGNGNNFIGQMAEVLGYIGVHTAQQIDDVEAHLAEKYGISI